MTVQPNEITEVSSRPISQELLAPDLTRLACVAEDGTPRAVEELVRQREERRRVAG
jgi:hypothetical protein